MSQNVLTLGQARHDFGLGCIAMGYLNPLTSGATSVQNEYTPLRLTAKEASDGDLQD
jgi:hypothetical protein